MGYVFLTTVLALVICKYGAASPVKNKSGLLEPPPPPITIHETTNFDKKNETGNISLNDSCVLFNSEDQSMIYKKGNCKMSTENGCTKVENCPIEQCYDRGGDLRDYGHTWINGSKLCACEFIWEFLYFGHDIPVPENGPPFPSMEICRQNGCTHPNPKEDGEIISGDVTVTYNGRTCTCRSGTDERLMDDHTLFHWKCEDGSEAWPSHV